MGKFVEIAALNRLLAFSAGIEGLTGVAMLAAPAVVTHLLLGADIPSVALGAVRLGGTGLLALAYAAWPKVGDVPVWRRSFEALLTYNLLTALVLLGLAIRGGWVGVLLWPAIGLHSVLTVLIVGVGIRALKSPPTTL